MPYREPTLFTTQDAKNQYLNFRHSGRDTCNPGYCYGPAVRHFYLIHYVISGKGRYTTGGNTYQLGKGDAFIIFPNEITSYIADEQDPWSYCFFAFDGDGCPDILARTAFSKDNLTISLDNDSLIDLIEETTTTLNHPMPNADLYALSQLLKMLKIFADHAHRGAAAKEPHMRSYVQQILDYIHFNYANALTISDMANTLSLNRSYFYRIFKEETGLSPSEYLNGYRIDRARQLLKDTNMPIGQIAVSTGFNTFSSFSRLFQIKYGQSPREFRKSCRAGDEKAHPLGSV